MTIAPLCTDRVDPAAVADRRADRAQARLLLGLLEREFEQVSAQISLAERCAADDHRRGFVVSAQRFEDDARTLWLTLGELHRMIVALRAHQVRP